MNLSRILSSPVRIQILQHCFFHGPQTTRQICTALSDIPKPTIYRQIQVLLAEEALIIQEERKVRGSTERLLAYHTKFFQDKKQNSPSSISQFLTWQSALFNSYAQKEDASPAADMLGLRTAILRLDDAQYQQLQNQIADLIGQYEKQQNREGKLRSLSMVCAPVPDQSNLSEQHFESQESTYGYSEKNGASSI